MVSGHNIIAMSSSFMILRVGKIKDITCIITLNVVVKCYLHNHQSQSSYMHVG